MERLATVSERGKRGIVREFIRQWKGAATAGLRGTENTPNNPSFAVPASLASIHVE
jgi:hypothetical protein